MKIGLALSGGGFRATIYHVGLVRFLRDAGILRQVNQITAVSGGSIFAAHLCLNWDRYNVPPASLTQPQPRYSILFDSTSAIASSGDTCWASPSVGHGVWRD